MKKPAAVSKSIHLHIENMLSEDPLTSNSRIKGTHDQYYGVYPKPFKNNFGIWLSIVIMWLCVWGGGSLAHLGVSYLGEFIVDDDEEADDDDDDDDSARRTVKINQESLIFTG